MRLVVAVAGLLLGAVPASAQYFEAPRPPGAIGPSLDNSAAEIVEAMGLEPIGPAVRSGAFLVQRATDDFGRVLRVTVDARRSQVLAVEAVEARGPFAPRGAYAGYQPYGPYAPSGYRGAYAMRGPAALEAPGSVMGAREPHRLPQPRSTSIAPDLPAPTPSAKPKTRSAAVTPQHPLTPTPRKRPAAAPQQAAGTVEPQAAPPPAVAPAPAPQPQNAMPPVTPLE